MRKSSANYEIQDTTSSKGAYYGGSPGVPLRKPRKRLVRSEFGQYLRDQRLGMNLIVEDFARICVVHRTTITHYEVGYTHPKKHVCTRIAQVIGVNKDELWKRCQDSKAAFGPVKRGKRDGKKRRVTWKLSFTAPVELFKWLESQKGDGPLSLVVARLCQSAHEEDKRRRIKHFCK